MPSGLLIIRASSAPLEPQSSALFNAYGVCETRDWQNCPPAALAGSTNRLIIADAASCIEQAGLFFRALAHHPIHVPVLALLPKEIDRDLLQTVMETADDFIFLPTCPQELEFRISRFLGPQPSAAEKLEHTLRTELGLGNLVGNDPAFLQAIALTKQFARSDVPVLITGETGTGKELFAHAIHSLSRRRTGPFVPLDCGSISEHLAEDELFGHHRGAFTDARSDRKGLVAIADGGTLFLDEVDSLTLANQAKFLRFLQEGTYRALGADRMSQVKVRAVAATNGSMEELVRQKQFRSDLYFRLNVLRLRLPALRERPGDISLLANHFLKTECASDTDEEKYFSRAALRKLESYAWPGNVRELFNVVQRAALCCRTPQIMPADLAFSAQEPIEATSNFATAPFRSAKQNAVAEFERGYLQDLLARHGGNITLAAREAGKDRRALGKLAKKYRILSHSA